MVAFKCKMCGKNLQIEEGMTVCECAACGMSQTLPNLDDERKISLFNRANRLRFGNEFDKAAGVYKSIVSEFQEEAEGYWGLCLCKYGVGYVDDPDTSKKTLVCYRTSYDGIFDDENFELVQECADVAARKIYREEAKAIDRIQKQNLAIANEAESFDIFISCQETDEDGNKTKDSVKAQWIYDELTARGYKVFFSRVTLGDKAQYEVEPYIFSALCTSKVMLAVGTTYENFNSVWIKNEYNRFLEMAKTDKQKRLVPCYSDIDEYDIPAELKDKGKRNMDKEDFMQKLLRKIEKLIPDKPLAAADEKSEDNTNSGEILYYNISTEDYEDSEEAVESPSDFGMTQEDAGDYIEGVLYSKDRTKLLGILDRSVENVKILNDITIIGESAFSGCSYLKTINIPVGVTSIGESAFSGCGSLTGINILENVTNIGNKAFEGCSSLKRIDISAKAWNTLSNSACWEMIADNVDVITLLVDSNDSFRIESELKNTFKNAVLTKYGEVSEPVSQGIAYNEEYADVLKQMGLAGEERTYEVPVEEITKESEQAEETAQASEPKEEITQESRQPEETAQASEPVEETIQASEPVEEITQESGQPEGTAQASEPVEEIAQASEPKEEITQESGQPEETMQASETVDEEPEQIESEEDVLESKRQEELLLQKYQEKGLNELNIEYKNLLAEINSLEEKRSKLFVIKEKERLRANIEACKEKLESLSSIQFMAKKEITAEINSYNEQLAELEMEANEEQNRLNGVIHDREVKIQIITQLIESMKETG